MAGNNTIQILRGNNVKTNSSINGLTLLDGQPLYDKATGYLYIGEGGTIASTSAINAHYANSAYSATQATTATKVSHNLKINAGGTTYTFNGSKDIDITISSSATGGSVDYATTAGRATTAGTADKLSNSLFINNGTSNVGWDGSVTEAIYVPTSLSATPGQVWGIKDGGGVGWISQTAIPGSIEQANTANFATKAEQANTANTADTATIANSVRGCLAIRMNPCMPTYYDGSENVAVDIYGYVNNAITNAIDDISAPTNMVTTDTAQTITGQKTFSASPTFMNRITINSGSVDTSLTANIIYCHGNALSMHRSPTGDILTDGSFDITTGNETYSETQMVSSGAETAFIVAWLEANKAGELLAARAGNTDLASATASAVDQRICISFISPRGQAANLYHPSSTGNAAVWYTKTIIG